MVKNKIDKYFRLYSVEDHIRCQSKGTTTVKHCKACIDHRILFLLCMPENLIIIIWNWQNITFARVMITKVGIYTAASIIVSSTGIAYIT